MHIKDLSQASASFLSSWQGIRENGAIPRSAEFLARPPYLLMKDTFIFESCPTRHTVRFMGTALVRIWLSDLTGQDFLQAVEPGCKEDARRQIAASAVHPTGFTAGAVGSTTEGRTVSFEILILPLAVDDGKPPRAVAYCSIGPIEPNDLVRSLHWQPEPRWLDIGFGVPVLTGKLYPL